MEIFKLINSKYTFKYQENRSFYLNRTFTYPLKHTWNTKVHQINGFINITEFLLHKCQFGSQNLNVGLLWNIQQMDFG
jgi:hypothetical protein